MRKNTNMGWCGGLGWVLDCAWKARLGVSLISSSSQPGTPCVILSEESLEIKMEILAYDGD